MLSYALAASSKINLTSGGDPSKDKKNYTSGLFDYLNDKKIQITREFQKYGDYNPDLVEVFKEILENNDFNVTMFVAAYKWYIGNGSPKVFTSDMFTSSNKSFSYISSVGFEGKKTWNQDSYKTLIIYGNFIRNNNIQVKKEDYKITVDDENPDDDNDSESDDDNGYDDYDDNDD